MAHANRPLTLTSAAAVSRSEPPSAPTLEGSSPAWASAAATVPPALAGARPGQFHATRSSSAPRKGQIAVALLAAAVLARTVAAQSGPRLQGALPAGPAEPAFPAEENFLPFSSPDNHPLRLARLHQGFMARAGSIDGSRADIFEALCPNGRFMDAKSFDRAARRFSPESLFGTVTTVLSILNPLGLDSRSEREIMDHLQHNYPLICDMDAGAKAPDCDHVTGLAPFRGGMSREEKGWTVSAMSAFLHAFGPKVFACGILPALMRSNHPRFTPDVDGMQDLGATVTIASATDDEGLERAIAGVYLAQDLPQLTFMATLIHEWIHAATLHRFTLDLMNELRPLGTPKDETAVSPLAAKVDEWLTEELANKVTGIANDSVHEYDGGAKAVMHLYMALAGTRKLTLEAVKSGRKTIFDAKMRSNPKAKRALSAALIQVLGRPESLDGLMARVASLPEVEIRSAKPAAKPSATSAIVTVRLAGTETTLSVDGALADKASSWPTTATLGKAAAVTAAAVGVAFALGRTTRGTQLSADEIRGNLLAAERKAAGARQVLDVAARSDEQPTRLLFQNALLHISSGQIKAATHALLSGGLLNADLSVPSAVANFLQPRLSPGEPSSDPESSATA